MRILFLSHQSSFIYGGEKVTLEIMRFLSKKDEVYFAAPLGPYFERAKSIVNSFAISSIEFQRKINTLPEFLPSFIKTQRELSKIISEKKIELIHATSLKSMVYAWKIGLLKKTPVIWHHHDILPDKFSNKAWVFFLAKGAAKIIVPSHATKIAFEKLKTHSSHKLISIYNGFDPKEWTKRPNKISGENRVFKIFIIGEISQRKGSDWIYPITEQLHKKFPNQFEISVVGEGLSDLNFAKKIYDENNKWCEIGLLKFLGRKENIPELLHDADALIILSRQDPLPTVIIEAYFSGVPVLGTPVGGIPEMIQDGVTGFKCSEPSDFVFKLENLNQNVRLWNEMSQNARIFAEKYFSIEKTGLEFRKVYENVLYNLT